MKQFSGEKPTPPIIYIILVQLITVIADFFGQRAARVVHKHSESRVVISLAIIGSMTILCITGPLQLFLPAEYTSAIYINDHQIQCYQQVDIEGTRTFEYCQNNPSQCTKIQCPTQGPGSIFRSLYLHPQLFMNGLLNLLYYTMEIMVYKHPFGLILVVISSLISSFFIPLLNLVLFPANPPADPLSGYVILLSIAGAACCMYTPEPPGSKTNTIEKDQHTSDNPESLPSPHSNFLQYWEKTKHFLKTLTVFIPVLLLGLAYGIWFAWQFTINEVYHVNTFGYNTIDQALLPIYLVPFMFLLRQLFPKSAEWTPKSHQHTINSHQHGTFSSVSTQHNETDLLIGISRPTSTVNLSESSVLTSEPHEPSNILDENFPPFDSSPLLSSKHPSIHIYSGEGSDYLISDLPHTETTFFNQVSSHTKPMSFLEVLKLTYQESKWPNWTAVFFYRFFSDVKALTYFLLALFYDLRLVSLELTLVRISFSWVGTLIGTYFFPSFLLTTEDEKYQIYHRKALILKSVGTCLIVGSLFLI